MTMDSPKNKTILHIVNSFETGGLERFVLDLIGATANNFRHIVICLDCKGDLYSSLSIADISYLALQPGIQFRAIFRIAEIVKSENVSLIHTHNWKPQFYGTLAGFMSKVPVVHTKHGRHDEDLRSRIRNNMFSRLCDNVVAVSKDAALQCIEVEKVPAKKVLTILNGINTFTFSPGGNSASEKTALGIDPGVLVLGIVARLAPVKDHATLLAACQIVRVSGYNFKLLVVGDGPLNHSLKAIAESLGILDCIIFTGTRQDIPELMRAMDVFILSSISEGISLTLLEAMACELPVIATAVGGNSEVVIEGETGFLVPAQNPEAMSVKIIQMINNLEQRHQLGKKGRQRAENDFSLSRAAKQYTDLYYAVIGS